MSWFEAIFLGIVQGLTEFLPVSSSGHLFVLQSLLGVQDEGIVFEVAVHVATLGAVVIVYRERIAELVVGALRLDPAAWRYGAKLGLATLPVVGAALAFGEFFEAQFESAPVVGFSLLFTGGVLWTTRRTVRTASRDEPGWGASFLIGCAQVAALLPGVSRSGATVAAAMALGVRPVEAAEFSFLMGLVAVTGAALRTLPEMTAVPPSQIGPLLVGGVASLIAGVFAIALFVRLLRTASFFRFAYYAWAVGALFLVWVFAGGGA